MKWIKRGLIFKPDYWFDWMKAYAWVPVIEELGGGLFKVYFSSRNASNMSQTGFFTFDIENPSKALSVSEKPVIELGPLGSFDDSAAVACSFVEREGKKYLYYVGWMQGKRVRYYPSIGVAISADGGKTFAKHSKAPILDRIDDDPFGMASPFVMFDGGLWKMWYASYRRWDMRQTGNRQWNESGEEPWPYYELRYAESGDGIHWRREGIVCITANDVEAVARPCILKEGGVYKMWFSHRLEFGTYRIGYAESGDGKKWEIKNSEVGIDVSPSGWDSEMIEYPCVFSWRGKKYMLYNGNTYGKDGIGLAEEQT